MVRRYFGLLIILLFNIGCASISSNKNSTSQQKDIGYEFIASNEIDSALLPYLDKELDMVITEFNSKNYSFKIHKKKDLDSNYMSVYFAEGHLATQQAITASYIVSALGIIVTPMLIYQASNRKFLLFFYYLANDKYSVYSRLTHKDCETLHESTMLQTLRSDATFSTKTGRLNRMHKMLHTYLLRKLKRQNRHFRNQ